MANSPIPYVLYFIVCVFTLKELNMVVTEPYMDEPFHVPQALAYCRGEWTSWDPKITTPPGLYVLSVIFHRIFMFKCTLPLLRLTATLTLLTLPLVLGRLLAFYQRRRPPPLLSPSLEAVVLSFFPIAWFFGFLYYTDVPGLVFVLSTAVAATQNKHWLAALLGLISCTMRQTNVVWVIYAFAVSQLMYLRFRREASAVWHDQSALIAGPSDIVQSILTLPNIILEILPAFIPYAVVLVLFGSFVVWNGGIVLGDKSNHIPSFHVPQLYYFIGFSTMMAWPVLLSGPGGIRGLRYICRRVLATSLIAAIMALSIQKFTIHHPFLLSDNRHYTFYIWRRIFMLHPIVPYLFIPGYQACAWAWFLRIAPDQTLLQTLVLPVLVLPTLLPTPLLEPRYFLVPYILLRAQVYSASIRGVIVEGLWYAVINAATMWIFLYKEREGVGRFMW
ncbi:glycosyltransferase family 59 protein [Serpula lacrymans var. lacrymans S7.9]|uniref:Dol-P-Glc:Glc(2)Man(9)GlcNAc(2)-PP-Dol alpha-1,2-glucosyltransferase n=1 Tax=Serpula lacrymans var. lacrymans (strain S7.9) TaxID=578457 RepID=F8NNA1_SERL9|nr:glycosyltransferase family 59 protein [Serpula lacrymans var. lacrymans S7.9]EGO27531.1 glycosyltransferase family 59 protein [Serpula lacrymans var. lacrymans S7.9]